MSLFEEARVSLFEEALRGPRIPLVLYDGDIHWEVEARALAKVTPAGRLIIEVSVMPSRAYHVTAWQSPAIPMDGPLAFHEGRLAVKKSEGLAFDILPNMTRACPVPDCPLGLHP